MAEISPLGKNAQVITYSLGEILPGASAPAAPAAQAAATGGIGSFFKSTWRFLQGDWGVDLGRAYRTAKLENKALIEAAEKGMLEGAAPQKVSIWNFGWKDAYKKINTEKELAALTEQKLKAVGEAALKRLGKSAAKISEQELIAIGKEVFKETGEGISKIFSPKEMEEVMKASGMKVKDALKMAGNDGFLSAIGKKAVEAGKKVGWFKKSLSFLGKKLGPALLAVFYVPRIFSEFKEGGIGAGLKETAKAAASLTAFALGGVLMGMCGFGGLVTALGSMVLGSALSFGSEAICKAVMGSSCAEKKAEIAKAQEEAAKSGLASTGTVTGTEKDIKAIDARMNSIKEYLDRKYVSSATGLNPPASPFGRTTAFSGLSSDNSSIFSNMNFGGGLNFGNSYGSNVYPG